MSGSGRSGGLSFRRPLPLTTVGWRGDGVIGHDRDVGVAFSRETVARQAWRTPFSRENAAQNKFPSSL
ncbi:hypothetical protein [Saccharopolyspora elongata]|uniref:hypothetical protein n=1 Tax=Saccharopolyspora elongata TaxID=2530387 RepID=UPI001044EE79|nr:hypothetical protein [Saccharopolyspora elongata]